MQLLVALAFAFLATALPAQRGKPTLEWQKRGTTIEYGVVPLGKHQLDELAVGAQWRLGMNEASTWSLAMPIVVGNRVLPPGQFRISLFRQDQKQLVLLPQGVPLALGGGDFGGGDVGARGTLGTGKKPAPKLALEWSVADAKRDPQVEPQGEPQADPKSDPPSDPKPETRPGPKDGKASAKSAVNEPVQLIMRFGEHEWTAPMTLLGGKTLQVAGGTLTVFAVPAAIVEARDEAPVPIAVLTRKAPAAKAPAAWNLVLGKSEARLVPWMVAPTDSFGFGEIAPPDADWTTTGRIEVADAAAGEPVPLLEPGEATLQKGELALQVAFGSKTARITVPEPKAKRK